MAEISFDVFDICHPSPVPLKALSAMAISLEIWRLEADKYRKGCALDKFKPYELEISSKTVLPDLPSVICDIIDRYIPKFGNSMNGWLHEHYSRIFYFNYDHREFILKDFDGFVCDYNGTIDYLKTAERMMLCDGFNVDTKFAVACTYCFEDDIRQIWPHVREKIRLDDISFYKSPQLYYWICCLKNELPSIIGGNNVYEEMLNFCMPYNRPSVEYFWNHIAVDEQVRQAECLVSCYEEVFTRFILRKLTDQQIDVLINCYDDGDNLVEAWLKNYNYDEELILQLWMRFKNMLNENTFKHLVVNMLAGTDVHYREEKDKDKFTESELDIINKKWIDLCREIWNTAADNVKRSTIRNILFHDNLFNGRGAYYAPTNVEFLLTILSYATFEDRNEFWFHAWRKLIECTRSKHLQQLMELCFNDQEDICRFKQNVLAGSYELKELCIWYLKENWFEDVNDILLWCLGSEQKVTEFHSNFIESASEGSDDDDDDDDDDDGSHMNYHDFINDSISFPFGAFL